ncbi:hypothetical protein BRARA_D01219 [Brassica rapa]|uniref:Uncharacterized protein n=1 Tax=Brassica campestris TaxID=3711 RepID=A0A397ZTL3_BRACM|nr:hypothetical protein BRARA_D01219 [Brassica rapa]
MEVHVLPISTKLVHLVLRSNDIPSLSNNVGNNFPLNGSTAFSLLHNVFCSTSSESTLQLFSMPVTGPGYNKQPPLPLPWRKNLVEPSKPEIISNTGPPSCGMIRQPTTDKKPGIT